jgi:hypothetical protein
MLPCFSVNDKVATMAAAMAHCNCHVFHEILEIDGKPVGAGVAAATASNKMI